MFGLLVRFQELPLFVPGPQPVAGYFGQIRGGGRTNYDGQGSGDDFLGTWRHPSFGYVNSCDGGRSHLYCDYRQQ